MSRAETIKKEKIKRIEIDYGYESEDWQNIRIEFVNGQNANVNREQITAFLRVGKVIEDLQQVQNLRDQLFKIFGSSQIVPPP